MYIRSVITFQSNTTSDDNSTSGDNSTKLYLGRDETNFFSGVMDEVIEFGGNSLTFIQLDII